ncbi:MAG: MaoC family dehydratase N-terminal domain-containing protein [Alphaproteobacteria bacterium]|jgi:acyl dehydratase|nr:MaoC family dehydratase N-terminal domain-containing protein [Alphaproteobacteria bacterium]
MSWGEITEEGLAAAASLIGAPLRRSRMQWIETASRDAIRHFAWGVGDDNPLWLDPDYARASPAGTLVAPPCILYAVDSTIVAPKLPGVQWVYAGTDWTWFDHIRLDDSFQVEAELTSQELKSGRRFARWALQSGEIRYTNQHGHLVATAIGRCARTPRRTHHASGAGEETPPAEPPHRYEPEELAEIERQILAEPRRGPEPLYWEDVAVGEAVPPVVKGPLAITDILAWYSATQGALPYGGAHGDVLRYRQRHADYHINPATGAKDAAGRGHLEAATGRDVGMGGAYDIGPQRIAWAQHMLTNWIGDHGFLHRLNVSVRAPNLVGSTIWWHGTVEAKRRQGAVCLVDLKVEAINQRQETSAFGTAVVALPSRAAGPVPLPLEPSG